MPNNRLTKYFGNTTGGLTESDVRETLGQQLEHRPTPQPRTAQEQSAELERVAETFQEIGRDEGREEMRVILNRHHRAAIATARHESYLQGAWDVTVFYSVVAAAVVLCWWRM